MSIGTSELSRRTGGGWCAAHVFQLIGLVPTVVVSVAYKVAGYAPAILAGELLLLACLVGAALLVTAIATVVTPVTSDWR